MRSKNVFWVKRVVHVYWWLSETGWSY